MLKIKEKIIPVVLVKMDVYINRYSSLTGVWYRFPLVKRQLHALFAIYEDARVDPVREDQISEDSEDS